MTEVSEEKLSQYREYLSEEEKSTATIEKYIRDVRSFMKWMDTDMTVTKERVIAYKQWLKEHYKTSSVNSMLVALNSFLFWLGDAQDRIRTVKVQQQMFRSAEQEMTLQEYKRLIDMARKLGREQTALIIETIGATGIRISELKYITAEAVQQGVADVDCKGKKRQVYLVHKLQEKLKKYCKKKAITKGSVFISCHGNPLDRSNIWKQLKTIGRAAGVAAEKVFPHNLRHLFGRIFWLKCKDVLYLADVLGHSSISSTRIYTATTGTSHVNRLQKLGLVT